MRRLHSEQPVQAHGLVRFEPDGTRTVTARRGDHVAMEAKVPEIITGNLNNNEASLYEPLT
jgi:hypothetical protein